MDRVETVYNLKQLGHLFCKGLCFVVEKSLKINYVLSPF